MMDTSGERSAQQVYYTYTGLYGKSLFYIMGRG
jgi:hypothetical protein